MSRIKQALDQIVTAQKYSLRLIDDSSAALHCGSQKQASRALSEDE